MCTSGFLKFECKTNKIFSILFISEMSTPSESKIVFINDFEHYLKVIEGEKRVIIVDFSATWCDPCKKLLPTLEQLSQQFAEKLLILKVDADLDGQLPEENQMIPLFKVEAYPTVVFLKNCTFQTGDDFRIEGLDLPKLKKALKTLADISF